MSKASKGAESSDVKGIVSGERVSSVRMLQNLERTWRMGARVRC